MARPKKGPRVIWRDQPAGKLYTEPGEGRRAYADLRSIGGGREALIPRGESLATMDPVIAQTLLSRRVTAIEEQKRTKHVIGIEQTANLKEFSGYHLVQKAKSGRVTAKWLAGTEKRLKLAISFFGEDRPLDTIGVRDVQKYANWLAEQDNGRGGTYSTKTQLEYLLALSNLFVRAQSEASVPPGFNPVTALMDKPRPKRREAKWPEVWEGALL